MRSGNWIKTLIVVVFRGMIDKGIPGKMQIVSPSLVACSHINLLELKMLRSHNENIIQFRSPSEINKHRGPKGPFFSFLSLIVPSGVF